MTATIAKERYIKLIYHVVSIEAFTWRNSISDSSITNLIQLRRRCVRGTNVVLYTLLLDIFEISDHRIYSLISFTYYAAYYISCTSYKYLYFCISCSDTTPLRGVFYRHRWLHHTCNVYICLVRILYKLVQMCSFDAMSHPRYYIKSFCGVFGSRFKGNEKFGNTVIIRSVLSVTSHGE